MDIIKIGTTGLYVLDDFLSARECRTLIQLLQANGTIGQTFRDDKNDKTKRRLLTYDHTPTVHAISQRMVDLTQFPIDHCEPLSLVCYPAGGNYIPHTDYDDRHSKVIRGGRRVAQMLFYLNTVPEGGETYFPNIGIKINPTQGRALLWYSVEGMVLPQKGESLIFPETLKTNKNAYHQPMPIIKGEKWIGAKFFHNVVCNH